MNRLFTYHKVLGTHWSSFTQYFPGRTPNNIKNKFYALLKKVATRAQLENPRKYPETLIKNRRNLLQFVDMAVAHGQELSSKRGRKPNRERRLAPDNAVLSSARCLRSAVLVQSLPSLNQAVVLPIFASQEAVRFVESGNINLSGIFEQKIFLPTSPLSPPEELIGEEDDYVERLGKMIEGERIRLPLPYSLNPIDCIK